MLLKCKYQDGRDLDVDYYPNFLDPELATKWFKHLLPYFPDTARRSTILIGDEGMIYTTRYRDNITHRPAHPWSELPGMFELKTLMEKITNQKYTVCAMQYYPSGKVGIGAHRDKEMVLGTRICGLSLGAARVLSFNRAYEIGAPMNLLLASGSVYVMNPPTNQKYTHAILKDASIKTPRISLTFRDYSPN